MSDGRDSAAAISIGLRTACSRIARGDRRAAGRALSAVLAADRRCAYGLFLRALVRILDGAAAGAKRDLDALARLPPDLLFRYHEFAIREPRNPQSWVPALDRFAGRYPRHGWFAALRAFVSRAAGRKSEGLEGIAHAVRLCPRDAALRAFHGNALFSSRRCDAGLRELMGASRLAPACGWIHAWLGEAWRRRGRQARALAALDRAVALDPGYSRAWAWRGALHRAAGRLQAAASDLDRALSPGWAAVWAWRRGSADPGLSWTLRERMLTRQALGDGAGALADLRQAHALDPRCVWADAPGRSPAAATEGRRALEALLEREPRNGWALAWRGWLNLETGLPGPALQDLDRARDLGASNPWVETWRGRALLAAGDSSRALALFTRAARGGYLPARVWRAAALRQLGQWAEAHRALDRFLRRDPGCAFAWAWRGELRLRQRRWLEALADLDHALQMDGGDFDALLWRAEARLGTGDRTGARGDVGRALRRQPGSWRAWALRSLLDQQDGDWTGQRLALRRALAAAPPGPLKAAEVAAS